MAKPIWHPPVEFVAGDTWVLDGNLTDQDGSLLDVSDSVLEWIMVDDQGRCVASYPGLAEITVAALGAITITLAPDVTETSDRAPRSLVHAFFG